MEGRSVNEDSQERDNRTLGDAVRGQEGEGSEQVSETPATEANAATEDFSTTTANEPLENEPLESAPTEPPTDEGDEPTEKKRRRWPWITAGAIVLLAAVYVGGAFYFADRVPAGTEVAGVEMGGLNRDEAAAKLKADVVDQIASSFDVQVAAEEATEDSDVSDTVTVDPADYSLAVDEKATVDSVVGFSLDPVQMWSHIAGGRNVDPVYTYDEGELSAVVDDIAKQANRDPKNAALAYDGTNPKLTEAETGLELKTDEAATVLSEEVLTSPSPIKLEADATEPDITTDAAKKVVEETATPLTSAPITIEVKGQKTDLSPEQLADAASFKAADGNLNLTIDGKKLSKIVSKALPDVLSPGKNARIEIVNHKTPKIIDSEDGVGIGAKEIAQAVKENAAAEGDDRTISLEPSKVPASFTTEDAKDMGIKEVVSEIETPLTDDAVRTTNLEVGTKKITNTLVKPGETFSLEEALGPITAENGFVSSGVVANGFNSTAMGGGLSQLSTNTFNIGYLGGMKDVEHKPHSKYFDRYPMGREATLWEGTIDMKWKNTTPYGVVVDTWVGGGKVHSQLWSTKYWDVKTSTSDPFNYVNGTTKTNPASDCEPSSYTSPGFTVTVDRTVSHDGKVNEEDSGSYNWTYSPVDAVKCN